MDFISGSLLGRLIRLGTGNDRFVSPPGSSFGRVFTPGTPQWERIVGREFEVYETTATLQTIIGRKAQMKSNGIWKHWEFAQDGNHKELFGTPLLERLDNPNPLQSKDEWLMEMSIHRDIAGAAFIYKLDGSRLSDVPAAIWNILPQDMTVRTTGKIYQQTDINEIISSFTYDESGPAKRIYKADEILYRKLNNPLNQLTPLSPFVGLTMEISNIRAAMGYRNVILRKKGAIGIISGESKDSSGGVPLGKKEKELIHDQYNSEYGLSDSQMQIFISSVPLKWQPMSYPTNELMLFEEVDANKKAVIDAYGMNENLFSVEEGQTMSDSGSRILEAERLVYQDKIIPESNDDARALSQYLGLTEEGQFLTLDYKHLPALKDDEKKKADILDKKSTSLERMVRAGMSLIEARELLGLSIEETQNVR